jgi:acetylornithine deacetylase
MTESEQRWQNSEFDPPTLSMNIGIKDNSPAMNVTAARSTVTVYFRTMPNVDVSPIVRRLQDLADRQGLKLEVRHGCDPFWKNPNSDFVQRTLRLFHRQQPKTVCYATDGGIFANIADKIVFGPGSILQAHTGDEWISLEQLNRGTEAFAKMIETWCCG